MGQCLSSTMRIKFHSYQVPLHPAVRRCVTPAALRCTSYKTKRLGNPLEEYYDQNIKERGNKPECVDMIRNVVDVARQNQVSSTLSHFEADFLALPLEMDTTTIIPVFLYKKKINCGWNGI